MDSATLELWSFSMGHIASRALLSMFPEICYVQAMIDADIKAPISTSQMLVFVLFKASGPI